MFHKDFLGFVQYGISLAFVNPYDSIISTIQKFRTMTSSFKIAFFLLTLIFTAMGSASAGGTAKEVQIHFMESSPRFTTTYTLEGKLLKIEGSVWLLEDLFGDHHRIQISADTRLPHDPKERGDSIHAIVRTDGHAWIIQ